MVGCLGWENAWVVTYERFIIKNLMVNLASQTSSLPWKIHRVHMFAQSSQALWWVDMSHWYFFESNILSSGCFMRIFNQRDYPDDNVKELVKSHLLYTKRPVRLGLYNTIIQASVSKVGVAKGLKQANFTRTELKDQVWWFFCNTYNWSSRFESSVGKFFQHLIFFGGGAKHWTGFIPETKSHTLGYSWLRRCWEVRRCGTRWKKLNSMQRKIEMVWSLLFFCL